MSAALSASFMLAAVPEPNNSFLKSTRVGGLQQAKLPRLRAVRPGNDATLARHRRTKSRDEGVFAKANCCSFLTLQRNDAGRAPMHWTCGENLPRKRTWTCK